MYNKTLASGILYQNISGILNTMTNLPCNLLVITVIDNVSVHIINQQHVKLVPEFAHCIMFCTMTFDFEIMVPFCIHGRLLVSFDFQYY